MKSKYKLMNVLKTKLALVCEMGRTEESLKIGRTIRKLLFLCMLKEAMGKEREVRMNTRIIE